ncbi:22105_t:CDS:2, partial [Gigaspora margarita]
MSLNFQDPKTAFQDPKIGKTFTTALLKGVSKIREWYFEFNCGWEIVTEMELVYSEILPKRREFEKSSNEKLQSYAKNSIPENIKKWTKWFKE